MRANAEVKASNWLKIGTSTMSAYEEVQQAEEGEMAIYTPIAGSRFMLPYWSPYNADGSIPRRTTAHGRARDRTPSNGWRTTR